MNQNRLLSWVVIGLSAGILTFVLMSLEAPFAGIDMRPLVIFLFLVPVSIAIFFLEKQESLTVTVMAAVLCVSAVVVRQYFTIAYSAWPAEKGPFGYLLYLTGPLLATGAIWEIILFLVLSYWVSSLYPQIDKKYTQLQELSIEKQSIDAKLTDERRYFSSLQKRYYEDTNHLNSLIMTLSDLAKEISSVLRLEGLLKLIMDKAARLFSASSCAIFSIDSAANKLVYACSIGYDEETLKRLKLTADEESGIIGWCAAKGKFLSVKEAKQDAHMADILRQDKFPVLFCQPILERGKPIVVLCVGQTEDDIDDGEALRLSSLLANLSSIAIENAKLMEKIRDQAIRDGLTGLYNHRYFYELLEEKMKQSKPQAAILGVFLIDIDHFKKFNDTYGHQIGDMILQSVAEIIQKQSEKDDVSARYGGEEFTILCLRKDTAPIKALAENLRRSVEQAVFKTGDLDLRVTISVGAAFYDPKKPVVLAASELVKQSDDALYKAKEAGRNKVCIFGG